MKYADFGLAIQSSWGTWIKHSFDPVYLKSGLHTFKIVAEGSSNPGNFNLDSLKFTEELNAETLNALITDCDKLVKDQYTEASFTEFEKALANAKTVVKSSGASLSAVNNAYVYLSRAQSALAKKNAENKTLSAEGNYRAFLSSKVGKSGKYDLRFTVLAKTSELEALGEAKVKISFVSASGTSTVEKKLSAAGADFVKSSYITAAGDKYSAPEGYSLYSVIIEGKSYDEFMYIDFSITKAQNSTPVLKAATTSFGVFTGMYCTPAGKFEDLMI